MTIKHSMSNSNNLTIEDVEELIGESLTESINVLNTQTLKTENLVLKYRLFQDYRKTDFDFTPEIVNNFEEVESVETAFILGYNENDKKQYSIAAITVNHLVNAIDNATSTGVFIRMMLNEELTTLKNDILNENSNLIPLDSLFQESNSVIFKDKTPILAVGCCRQNPFYDIVKISDDNQRLFLNFNHGKIFSNYESIETELSKGNCELKLVFKKKDSDNEIVITVERFTPKAFEIKNIEISKDYLDTKKIIDTCYDDPEAVIKNLTSEKLKANAENLLDLII